MPTGNDAALKALADATAATIQATVQRWWIDPAHPRLLHIAAERTFVGARPIAVHFIVRLHPSRVEAVGPPRMQVGVTVEPPPVTTRPTSGKSVTKASARKGKRQVRAKAASQPPKKRKTPAKSTPSGRVSRPKKRVPQSRPVKRGSTPKRSAKRVPRARPQVKRQATTKRIAKRVQPTRARVKRQVAPKRPVKRVPVKRVQPARPRVKRQAVPKRASGRKARRSS